MRADADGAGDEQERDHTRADRLEFGEAERVSWAGRPAGQPPRKQNDKVAQEVYRKMLFARQQMGVLSHSTSFKWLRVKCQTQWIDTSSMMGHAGAHAKASPKAPRRSAAKRGSSK